MGKRFSWLKGLLERWGLQKKSATALPPTDPLSSVPVQIWSQEFLRDLTEKNPFQKLLEQNENLRGVPAKFKEPQELQPASAVVKIAPAPSATATATPPASASAPAPASTSKREGRMEQLLENGHMVTRTFDRNDRLRSFTNDSRLRELQTKHFNETGVYFFDPQCDLPLEKDFEKVADQMTPLGYLRWLLKEYGGQVNPYPQNEFEGRRAVRKFIRNRTKEIEQLKRELENTKAESARRQELALERRARVEALEQEVKNLEFRVNNWKASFEFVRQQMRDAENRRRRKRAKERREAANRGRK